MRRIRFDDDGWARCGKCGHKLLKVEHIKEAKNCGIEIKCHSCKEVNTSLEVWIFTFGCGQEHEGHYVTFSGDFNEARYKMIAEYGVEWAFQYSQVEWNDYVKKARDKGYPIETELA